MALSNRSSKNAVEKYIVLTLLNWKKIYLTQKNISQMQRQQFYYEEYRSNLVDF